MKRIIILCLLLIFSLGAVASADLDAPAEKKVTVRSEIERGKSAVRAIDLKARSRNPSVFFNKVDDVLAKNQQDNTDTDAFLFGVYGQTWIYAVLQTELFAKDREFWRGRLTDGQIESFNRITELYYKQFRDKQRQLNISDEDLLKLFTFKEEWLAEWDKKVTEQ